MPEQRFERAPEDVVVVERRVYRRGKNEAGVLPMTRVFESLFYLPRAVVA